ncbi:phosphate signaling complex PhoU family protein [Sulfurospirillum arcachonense]|uniref:phosphate signaling complex PhoU family protein n=1 Tax=Sulfurospirillum arcachonense TaxID=57666 RepID=UPI00046859CB|nr:phosphate uptake regulator PhoU [Sulfurospirillum arcachonense]
MLDRYEEQLQELKVQLHDLGADIKDAVASAEIGVQSLDISKFNDARDSLKNVEQSANDIDQNILKILALFEPEAVELREIVAYLKITSELVRLSDNVKSFSKRMKNHITSEIDFTTLQEYSNHLAKSAFKAITCSIESLEVDSKDAANDLYRKTCVEESKTDDLYSILEKNIMADLCKDIEKSAESIEILSTMRKLERMADRAVNITKLMLFARVGGEIKHFG